MPAFLPVPIIFANLPTGDFPASYFDQDFAKVVEYLNSIGSFVLFPPIVVTTAGPFVIPATANAYLLNKAVASATTLFLPPAASRLDGAPLVIADLGGNAGDITLTPSGTDKVMGEVVGTLVSNGQGLGGGGRVTLYSSPAAGGWFAG